MRGVPGFFSSSYSVYFEFKKYFRLVKLDEKLPTVE